MATDCIAQLTFRYQGLRSPIVARFDVPHASSDGGPGAAQGRGRAAAPDGGRGPCLTDPRQPGKVAHSLLDLVRQRVFGLAAGYLDGNDAARLADDPLHKLVLDREPLTGPALGSQPTLSRFENGVGRRDLVRVGHGLARTVIAHHRRRLHGRARRITIDLDPTDDPTHGQQELSFFNGHYDTACYLPLVATLTFDDEPIQYLVGHRAAAGQRRRRARGDRPAALAAPGAAAGLPARHPARPAGRRLRGAAAAGLLGPGRRRVRRGAARQSAPGQARPTPARPRAGAVPHHGAGDRRVRRDALRRQELGPQAPRDHEGRGRPVPGPRAPRQSALRRDQSAARARGRLRASTASGATSRIATRSSRTASGLGRTSCPRFLANQFRVLLTATAYILFQTLQQHAQGTACAGAQVATLRERLIKLAVWITRSARRIVLHLPRACPWLGRLAPARAGGRRSGRLTAAPPPRPARPTAGVVSPPSLSSNGRPARPRRVLGRAPAGFLAASTFSRSSDAIVVSPRAVPTHVVRPFVNRSG